MGNVFVDVILPLPIKGTFTYVVPEQLFQQLTIGKRVLVNFGRNKFYSAIISKIHTNTPQQNILPKSVISVLDKEPIVSETQLKLWFWIADYYLTNIGDVMNAALPSVFKLNSETKVAIHPDFDGDITNVNTQELKVINFLQTNKQVSLNQLCELLDNTYAMTQINNMVDKCLIYITEEVVEKFKQKNETFISFSEEYMQNEQLLAEVLQKMESKKNTQEQANTILQLLYLQSKNNYPFVKKSELLQHKSVTESRISSLILKKIFVAKSLPVSRLPRFKSLNSTDSIVLTEAQNEAFKQICTCFSTHKKALLHGVTGSGKTEIYIKLIQQTIDKGQQVLYLLPEIALTEQIINRLRLYFGEKVGVYHSKYNVLQRAEIWQNLNNNKPDQFQIILGARSSIFLPFKNLGLIIIDEEHDNSYKQHEPAPRYNARDTAIVLANFHNANLLLGTATPALETYYNTLVKKYEYISLTERYKGIQLPTIELVDIKKAKFQGEMKEHFSLQLLQEIDKTISGNEQVILFQNRRGFAPHLECPVCNYIPHCKNCDVTLTYHKHDQLLHCHYCGFSQKLIHICPKCNTTTLDLKGFGTERVEDELTQLFPSATIDRLDYDATRHKNSFQQIIQNFESGKTNILVGTQMITKGLDFDNVSLVGVLNADNILNYPDFRSFERAFQLLMQVSGRAGRKNKQGKVLIQTQNPQHDIFQYLKNQDNKAILNRLLNERKQFYYPPYCRLVKICLQHKDHALLNNLSTEFAKLLKQYISIPIFGPEDALIPKVKNMFIKEILIKLPIDKNIVNQKMANHKSQFKRIRQNEKRRLENRYWNRTMRNSIKKIRFMHDVNEASAALPKVVSLIDKVAKKGIIHKNKAANLKSGLMIKINNMAS